MLSASITTAITSELHHLSGGLVLGLVALLVFGEAALFFGFVLPGETSVIVGGVVASEGHLNIATLCIVVIAAAIIGDTLGYEIGRRYGHRLIELRIVQRRRIALERALEGLRHRGPLYVFLGRFTAFLRAVMPGLAGMSQLAYRRFFFANAAGAVLWGVAYSLLGYFAGHELTTIEKYSSVGTITLLVVLIGGALVVHFATKRRHELADERWRVEHPLETKPDEN
ncbi:MAG: DedA family protein [Acidimicrobiales bacterium]